MNLEELDEFAIWPRSWPASIKGYGRYCEHVAITADVGKAVTGDQDFDEAALKAWFAAGYLHALTVKEADALDTSIRRPDGNDLPLLERLLVWLAPIHRSARDGSDVTDTATLAYTFHEQAKATLTGLHFQCIVPGSNRDGVLLRPDPTSRHQLLSEETIKSRSAQARDKIYGAALWLGRHHRPYALTHVPKISRTDRKP